MIKYEKDLYKPVKRLFEENGFAVKGEIKDCDIIALKEEELIVCELKMSFNLKLVYQLIDRKTITPLVYAAIATPKKEGKNIKRLLREIDCGLIYVSQETEIAEVVLNPSGVGKKKKSKKTKRSRDRYG